MILRRLGNKSRIAKDIIPYFPPHKLYIEPFFGAGGMFFNKPRAKHNILNDLDSDVYNLFHVLSFYQEDLRRLFSTMPIHEDLWEHWKSHTEVEPLRKALRFLFLSNYGFLGLPQTLRWNSGNTSQILLDNIEKTHKLIFGCEFMNCDFRKMFDRISFKSDKEKQETLIYCDPPYLNTANNYSAGFTPDDSADLFDTLEASGCNWVMSEFDHPFIIQQADQRGLNVIEIGMRKNLGNRRMEIIVTNFERRQGTLF